MKLYFKDVIPYLNDMFTGLGYSVLLTVISMALGMVVGIAAYLGKSSSHKCVSAVSKGYIELIRNTPMLVQLYILYFGLPEIGVDLSPLTASVIAMVINGGAYIAEIMRSGFQSIPYGLQEAGMALGMTSRQIFFSASSSLLQSVVQTVIPLSGFLTGVVLTVSAASELFPCTVTTPFSALTDLM